MPSRHPEQEPQNTRHKRSSRRPTRPSAAEGQREYSHHPTPQQQKEPLPDAPTLLTQLNDSLTTLAEELSHGKSERLLNYLAFAARFHQYSRGNQWLIEAQLPTATRVASYTKWQEEGYQVAKGAKGIRILAPSIRKIRPGTEPDIEPKAATTAEQNAEEPAPAVAEERRGTPSHDTKADQPIQSVMRFVAVSVFDVSQLTPEKRPPEFFVPLAGESDALQQRLVEAATSDGFNVQQSDYTRGAQGYSQGRTIVTRSDLTSVNRTLTTIHEYAHALLHQGAHPLADRLGGRRDLSKVATWVKECHAEATAYVVAKHFDLPTPYSADYLLHWGTTPDALRTELDVVLAAAGHIIRKIEGDQKEQGSQDPFLRSESSQSSES